MGEGEVGNNNLVFFVVFWRLIFGGEDASGLAGVKKEVTVDEMAGGQTGLECRGHDFWLGESAACLPLRWTHYSRG